MKRGIRIGLILFIVVAILGYWLIIHGQNRLTVAVSRLEATTLIRVAESEGMFEARGLDVGFVEDDLGKFSLKRLLDGQVDVATAAEFPIVAQSFKRDDLRVIGTIHASERNIRILAHCDSGIEAPGDLSGKRIGTTKGTVGEYFLYRYLLQHNVEPNTVRVIDLTPSDIVLAMDRGEIDGFSLREPHVYRAEERACENVVTFPLPDEQVEYEATFNLVTKVGVARRKRKQLRLFLDALLEAETFVESQSDVARLQVGDSLGLDISYLDTTWADSDFTLHLDQDLLDIMEEEAFWRIEQGLIFQNSIPDLRSMIDGSFLNSLAPDAVDL